MCMRDAITTTIDTIGVWGLGDLLYVSLRACVCVCVCVCRRTPSHMCTPPACMHCEYVVSTRVVVYRLEPWLEQGRVATNGLALEQGHYHKCSSVR